MTFAFDAFAATDPTLDLTLSGVVRKLLRRGYGVSSVDEGASASETFDAGDDTEGRRATRVWSIQVSGAPSDAGFAGLLAVRETCIDHGPADPQGRPVRRWYELLPDSASTAKVLKAHDGY